MHVELYYLWDANKYELSGLDSCYISALSRIMTKLHKQYNCVISDNMKHKKTFIHLQQIRYFFSALTEEELMKIKVAVMLATSQPMPGP